MKQFCRDEDNEPPGTQSQSQSTLKQFEPTYMSKKNSVEVENTNPADEYQDISERKDETDQLDDLLSNDGKEAYIEKPSVVNKKVKPDPSDSIKRKKLKETAKFDSRKESKSKSNKTKPFDFKEVKSAAISSNKQVSSKTKATSNQKSKKDISYNEDKVLTKIASYERIPEFVGAKELLERHFNERKQFKSGSSNMIEHQAKTQNDKFLNSIAEELHEESHGDHFEVPIPDKSNSDLQIDSGRKPTTLNNTLKDTSGMQETPAFSKRTSSIDETHHSLAANNIEHEEEKFNDFDNENFDYLSDSPDDDKNVFTSFLCQVDLSVRQPSPKRDQIYGKDKINPELIKNILNKNAK